MPRYLLDTNALSALVAHPTGPIAQKLRTLADGDYLTSIVAAAELRFGAARRGSAKLTHAVTGTLARMPVEPLAEPADAIYATIRADLERRGLPMSANDLWIAAHALAIDCILVTADQAFDRVPGLTVENWLR